jgi:addiction module HigA family antidote
MFNGVSVLSGKTAMPIMLKLWIIIKEKTMRKKTELLDPIPPGEILLEDFMKPLSISMNQLARDIDVPPGRISEIVHAKRSITADTALRLGKYFGISPEIWLNLQADYDMRLAQRTIWPKIEARVRVRAA